MTQQKLAAEACGDESYKSRISEIERGKVASPHQKTVDALVRALGIPLETVQALHDETGKNDHVTGIDDISEKIVTLLSQQTNCSMPVCNILDIFPDEEFDTMRALHDLLFFGIVSWEEHCSPFIENLDISLASGWTTRFSSENFADPKPTADELKDFLEDLINFYTRIATGFFEEHHDQLNFINYQRERYWEKNTLVNAGPHLRFSEIAVFFETRGLCYSKIIACLRELLKQGDILCDENVYYARPVDFLRPGIRTRIRRDAYFLPSPTHTSKVPELKSILYHR